MPPKPKPTVNLAEGWTLPTAYREGDIVTLTFDDGDTINVTVEQWETLQSLLASGESLTDEFDDEIVISLKAQQYLYELIDDFHNQIDNLLENAPMGHPRSKPYDRL